MILPLHRTGEARTFPVELRHNKYHYIMVEHLDMPIHSNMLFPVPNSRNSGKPYIEQIDMWLCWTACLLKTNFYFELLHFVSKLFRFFCMSK